MVNALAILGPEDQCFSLRPSKYEDRFALWHTAYFFRASYLERSFPKNPFDLKRFLSRFSMLPVLFLELFEDIYPYKREAFDLAPNYFAPEVWQVFHLVTRARERWNPARMCEFNASFHRDVFTFSELLLDRLKELDSGN
jgi:hypothetical protein